MSELRQGSMRKFINNIWTVLRTDEELMRLLHYKPADYHKGRLDPLDKSLPDIVDDSEKYWDLVENLIITGTKSSDIQENGICRIYLYAGRRRPRFGNFLVSDQEVVVDLFVHESFDRDDRLNWISDRINELLALESFGSYGKLEYAAGNSRVAPIGYSKYEHLFTFVGNKK